MLLPNHLYSKNNSFNLQPVLEISKIQHLLEFPIFKKIELADKKEINAIVNTYEPYSDFNFTSLWSYNTHNDFSVSVLNNNLVIKFTNYFNAIPFYSYLGNNNPMETINILLEQAKKENIDYKLKLIPEINIASNPELYKEFNIIEDRDNYDYILSVDELNSLETSKYSHHRKHQNAFHKTYPDAKIVALDLKVISTKNEIINLFERWEQLKGKQRKDTKHELIALRRILQYTEFLDLLSLGVYINNELVGFSIVDLGNYPYAQSHFSKANPQYNGLRYILHHTLAKELYKREYKFINIEQDLGIPGLRFSKEQARPVHFLKKYTISKKF